MNVLAAVAAMLLAAPADSAGEEGLFPFVVSYDAPANAANVSAWLERPAGKHGFVRAQEGRLASDAGPIRLWATNLCFDACFPTHAQAEQVAARLARLGINCVRMHHMDSHSIWGDSPNKLTIDPKKLERLDYLIHQLKKHGVYTDLNLHVSRWFGDAEGFPHQHERPDYDKGLDNFEPRMIELQRRYARDLLTHVNPYTGTAYAQEPAVAVIEINNENALFAIWGWGGLDALPDPYAATFRTLWNRWLRAKYGGTERLARAWNVGRQALGEEMLTNGDFARPFEQGWQMEGDEQTVVQYHVERRGEQSHSRGGGDSDGQADTAARIGTFPAKTGSVPVFLRVVVGNKGQIAWHPQFNQARLKLRKDSAYTVTCRLRADEPRKLSITCMMAHEPWQPLGMSQQVPVGPRWTAHRFTFVAVAEDDNVRLGFSDLDLGRYDFAEVSMRPGGIVGVQPGQRLEDDSVPVLAHGSLSVTPATRRDFVDFLWQTERGYWSGMYRYLKDSLGVRPLVSGTQLNYSPVHVQARLDYIDSHAYWHHPSFPGRPWDGNNWYVNNVALVNSPGGTLAGLAGSRVAGLPYTVSEYNHPAPNQYAAEGFPMIAAFGALQGWDGIFSFAYAHGAAFEPRRIDNFFDIQGHVAKLVHMPACAAMFLRGDVSPARQTVRVPLAREAELRKLYQTMSAWDLNAQSLGVDMRLALLHALAIDVAPAKGQSLPPPLAADARRFVSDTRQVLWDVSRPGAGYFLVNTPRTKLFTGFVGGRTFRLGDVGLRIGRTRLDWATISLVALDGEDLKSPGRVLVAATGWVQNRGQHLESLGGERVTLRSRWGSEPILCEGVPAEIRLPAGPSAVRLYPLDERGNRRAAVPCAERDGQYLLRLSPQHRTLWYEAEIQ
jgi:hypothetical protein